MASVPEDTVPELGGLDTGPATREEMEIFFLIKENMKHK